MFNLNNLKTDLNYFWWDMKSIIEFEYKEKAFEFINVNKDTNEFLNIKDTKLKNLFNKLKNYNFSVFHFIQSRIENYYVTYNKDKDKFVLKVDNINKKNIKSCFVVVKEYTENGSKIKYKTIWSKENSIFDEDVLTEIDIKSVGSTKAERDIDYFCYQTREDISLVIEVIKEGSFIFSNNTHHFMYVDGEIIYPYGIGWLEKKPIDVRKINRLYLELDNITTDENKSSDEGFVIGNYNSNKMMPCLGYGYSSELLSRDFFYNNLYPILQFGDMFVYEKVNNIVYNNKLIKLQKDQPYDIQVGPLLLKNAEYNASTGEVITGEFVVKNTNNEIYYKNKDTSNYIKAIFKDGGFYDKNGKKIGDRAFKIAFNKINKHKDFLYKAGYYIVDGVTYPVYSKVINIKGYELFSEEFKEIMFNDLTIKDKHKLNDVKAAFHPAALSRIVSINDDCIVSISNIDGKENKMSYLTSNSFGLISDKPEIKLIGINLKEIDLKHYPESPQYKNLRDKNNTVRDVLILTVEINGEKYDIMYIDKTDDKILGKDNTKKAAIFRCSKTLPKNPLEYFVPEHENSYNLTKRVYIRKHTQVWNNDWTPKDMIVSYTAPFGNFKPSIPYSDIEKVKTENNLVSGVKMKLYNQTNNSTISEYLYHRNGFSNLLNKFYIRDNETGLIVFIDYNDGIIYNIKDTFDKEIIIDNNKRGIRYTAGELNVEIYIAPALNEGTNRLLYFYIRVYLCDNINNKTQEIYNTMVDYKSIKTTIKRKEKEGSSYNINEDSILFAESRQNYENSNILFSPEIFLNYLYKKGIKQYVVVNINENDFIVDDTKVTLEEVIKNEGRTVIANYNNQTFPVSSFVAAINVLNGKLPYDFYGDIIAKITSSFKFNVPNKYYSDQLELCKAIIDKTNKNQKNKINIIIPVTSTQNPFMNLTYNIPSRIVSLMGKQKIAIPPYNRLDMYIELGVGNNFSATKEFNYIDNIYSRIDGVCVKNYIDKNNTYHIEYFKVFKNVIYKRKIDVDIDEQTTYFSYWFNNAKSQLITDLREDTLQKRLDGSFVNVEFDVQKIEDSTHSYSDVFWEIPVSFLCDVTYDETIKNHTYSFRNVKGSSVSWEELVNKNNYTRIYFDNDSSSYMEFTIEYKNTNFFNSNRCSYDVTDIKTFFNTRQILYNDEKTTNSIINYNY